MTILIVLLTSILSWIVGLLLGFGWAASAWQEKIESGYIQTNRGVYKIEVVPGSQKKVE